MAKKNDITRLSDEAAKKMLANGGDLTNRAQIGATSVNDPDDVENVDWAKAVVGLPPRKDHINIRIDHDVLEWFKGRGKGYQTMMNNVLRAFVQTRRQAEKSSR
jgi:uncharacterized protein (DUF4415 family)